ncbi:hypothetical protein A6F68_00693 [Tsuneonella dongtanensis]|uniref:Uncharacterized protein n=1 Tax=Tsuneonella dongtanensis TaxID=692370 RepID=A0A1B2AAR4_9SPHN|nr:hypothetical protein A6F68_00693 [Tsuneonella dongtanensis]
MTRPTVAGIIRESAPGSAHGYPRVNETNRLRIAALNSYIGRPCEGPANPAAKAA